MSEATTGNGESFAELFEVISKPLKEGEVVSGIVLSVDDDNVQIDIGFKSEGLVPTWEFMEDDGTLTIVVGDTVDVLLEESEDSQGRIVLSKAPRGWKGAGLRRILVGIDIQGCVVIAVF